MEHLTARLAQSPVFSQLPPSEFDELARLARCRRLAPGEFVCHQGNQWANAIYLASGQLRWAMLSPAGREYVLYLIEPGKVFWGHSFFDDQPMPASLQALQPSEIYQFRFWIAIRPYGERSRAVWSRPCGWRAKSFMDSLFNRSPGGLPNCC